MPVEITLLRHLERLTLSNNRLSELPQGFKRLKKMESLHMANNQFEKFPIEICDLTELNFLDMCDNKLKVSLIFHFMTRAFLEAYAT